MDYAVCNIIYVDRSAGEDRYIKRDATALESPSTNLDELSKLDAPPVSGEVHHVHRNIQILLETFSEGTL